MPAKRKKTLAKKIVSTKAHPVNALETQIAQLKKQLQQAYKKQVTDTAKAIVTAKKQVKAAAIKEKSVLATLKKVKNSALKSAAGRNRLAKMEKQLKAVQTTTAQAKTQLIQAAQSNQQSKQKLKLSKQLSKTEAAAQKELAQQTKAALKSPTAKTTKATTKTKKSVKKETTKITTAIKKSAKKTQAKTEAPTAKQSKVKIIKGKTKKRANAQKEATAPETSAIMTHDLFDKNEGLFETQAMIPTMETEETADLFFEPVFD